MRRSWRGLREWCRKGIRSTAEAPAVLEEVIEAMRSAGYPREDLFAVRLALEEALVNALKHGHRGDTTKVVRFQCWATPRRSWRPWWTRGKDSIPTRSRSTDEDNQQRSGGRGLLLMRAYATSLAFNERGNGLIFRRRRTTG